MKVAAGLTDGGVVIGNTYDKYGTRNPIARILMRGFDQALSELVALAAPRTIHEVGCGEGHWVLQWHAEGYAARGTDFSAKVIELARANAAATGAKGTSFEARSIYELQDTRDSADLIVCSEVLEHLERPREALQALNRLAWRRLIITVPREPLWRVLNVARGKYLDALGNTPGHVQHWSRRAFVTLVQEAFDVLAVRSPIPWTLVLCSPRDGR